MSIFTPDFSTVDATIHIYEKGRYRVKVTKRTPFAGESDDGRGNITPNGGIRYGLEMVGKYDEKGELITDDLMGKAVTPYKVWLHSEGGWGFAKPFLMAGAGYTLKQEKEANVEVFQKGEWTFNGEKDTPPDNIEIGASYNIPVGKMLDVNLSKKVTKSKKPGDDTEFENQEYGGWAPVK